MPPAPSLTLVFLAPSLVSSHLLATKRAIQSVFSQAFHLPSSWLDITLTEDAVSNVKTGAHQKLFVMIIEITSTHTTMELLATMRRVIGDDERLAHLLSTAVPGATLIPKSTDSPPPPPQHPPLLPLAPPSNRTIPVMTTADVGRELHCNDKLCLPGFKCPEGSVQPVAGEEGTVQSAAAASACVRVVVPVAGLDAENTTKSASEDLDSEGENITVDEETWFDKWIAVLACVAAVGLCCCAGCVLFVWRAEKKRLLTSRLKQAEGVYDGETERGGGPVLVGRRAQEGRLEVRKDGDRRSSKTERPLPRERPLRDTDAPPGSSSVRRSGQDIGYSRGSADWLGDDAPMAARLAALRRWDSTPHDLWLNPGLADPAGRVSLLSTPAELLAPRQQRRMSAPYVQEFPSMHNNYPSASGSESAQRRQSRLGPEASSSLQDYARRVPSSANLPPEGFSQRGMSQERLVLQALTRGSTSKTTDGGAMVPVLDVPTRRLSSTSLAASSLPPRTTMARRRQPTEEESVGSSPGWDRL